MSISISDGVDSDEYAGYLLEIYQEGELVGTLVATTFEIAEELCDLILEEDEEEVLDGCAIVPVKFNTINQFHSVH